MNPFRVRRGRLDDPEQLTRLRHALWPEFSAADHAKELDLILAGRSLGILPEAVFVAESNDGALLGFLETGLRSYADGCDPAHPIGYVEGWYVAESHRRRPPPRGRRLGANSGLHRNRLRHPAR